VSLSKVVFLVLFDAVVFASVLAAWWFLEGRLPSISRAFWRLKHRQGCPPPFHRGRTERLGGYYLYSFGCTFQVEVFDIRAACPRCGRLHRLEERILTPTNSL